MLLNAGSLIGTSAVTSVLGFAYWWLAARQFPPMAVGLASAAISAMTLLGTMCMLGLGTLLIGELPRQPGKEASLISSALVVVGGVGGCVGIAFALLAPVLSIDFRSLGAGLQNTVLFAVGVSLTAMTLILDQAFIGLLRGELQLWRNALFSVIKLGALFLAGLYLAQKVGMTIYTTWTIGNVLSLAALAGFAAVRGGLPRDYRPEWSLLRKQKYIALQHHLFNLTLQAPSQILPVLVTTLLSATVNAWFYVSLMLANFVFLVILAFTTVLYAVGSAEPDTLSHKVRLTLGLAVGSALIADGVLLFGTKEVLALFGHVYADQAAWSLRILALGAFPLIIKNHYVTIVRIRSRMASAMVPILGSSLLELGTATLGAHFGGLAGLSMGWVIGLCLEAIWMFRTVYRAALPAATPNARVQVPSQGLCEDHTPVTNAETSARR